MLRATSATLRRSIGGTSGPLYAIMLLRAAAALPSSTPQHWAAALRAGVDGVREVGGAEVGDRTMVDALSPAADAFEAAVDDGVPWRDALSAAADAAAAGGGGHRERPGPAGPVELPGRPGSRPPGPGRPGGGPLAGRDRRRRAAVTRPESASADRPAGDGR